MKILLVTDRLPWPPDSGRKSTLFSFCKHLNEDWGMEIVIASFSGGSDEAFDQKPGFISKLFKLKNISFVTVLFNIFFRSILGKKSSFQNCLYYSRQTASCLKNIANQEKPDAIVFNMLRAGQYIPFFEGIPCIFDMDDQLSKRYEMMIRQDDTKNALGDLGAKKFGVLSKLFKTDFVSKFVLQYEMKRVREEEIRFAQSAKATVLVNPIEVSEFSSQAGLKNVHFIPNRVDTDHFFCEAKESTKNSLGFHGLMSMPHNIQSVEGFAQDVYPHILSQKTDCSFDVVGGGVSENLVKKFPNVCFHGYVEDVRSVLCNTSVYCAWILGGTGMKTKILEALSMGIPLVTTSLGVHGIDVTDGVHCLIRDNPKEFAKAVVDVLNNPDKQKKLSNNSREFVFKNFHVKKIISLWKDVISEVVQIKKSNYI